MTTFDLQRLMALVPAVYRLRDAEQDAFDLERIRALEQSGELTPEMLGKRGGPLQALLAVIAQEIATVEENLAQLYDDHFIETCAEWVVPYIGDVVGHRTLPLPSAATRFSTPRAEVANAITYRRRKGTAAILEQLAHDVTGWPARLIEYFQLLSATQHLNHLRPRAALPDFRRMSAIERVGSPFDATPRSLEVRRIGARRGRYNIPNLGLVLWRIATYDIESGAPRLEASGGNTRFRFNSLGLDAPLLNPPRVEEDPLGFAAETDLPDPLTRRSLARELDVRRAALVNGDDVVRRFFAESAPLAVSVAGLRVPDDQVLICDLSTWVAVPATRSYRRRSDGVLVARPIGVAVDPVLGRLAFPAAVDPDEVRVAYTYGFPADLGGGPYPRDGSVATWLDPVRRPATWQIGVSREAATLATSNPPHSAVVATLAEAVAAWTTHVTAHPGAFGIIALMDSASYVESLTGADRIEVPAGSRLAVVAGDWPRADAAGPGGPFRPLGGLSAQGKRPHLRGDLSVCGTTAPDEALPDGTTRPRTPGDLIVDGLLIEGELRVLVGDLGELEIRHSTLVPAEGGLTVNASVTPDLQNAALTVVLAHAVTGPVTLPSTAGSMLLTDTIIAGDVVAPGGHLQVSRTTIIGTTTARALDASDAIFVQPVTAERRQQGCMRYCHVPAASSTPRRFRCQPDLAVSRLADPAMAAQTAQRVAPQFTSLRYGDPGYLQLAERCAAEIRMGASDGAEMGAFNLVKQPQREANLRLRLREHLRVGLEAGTFYRT